MDITKRFSTLRFIGITNAYKFTYSMQALEEHMSKLLPDIQLD